MFHSVSAHCFTSTFCIHYQPTQCLYSVIHYQYITMLCDTSTLYQHCYVLVYYNNKNASCLFVSVLLISEWTITFGDSGWGLYNFQTWMHCSKHEFTVPKLCAYLWRPPFLLLSLVSLGFGVFIYVDVFKTAFSRFLSPNLNLWIWTCHCHALQNGIWMRLRSYDTADVAL